ncbi:unnamed protein product [Diamesa tonsa]
MPVKKQEAHRALELLEDYHSRLGGPQDRALRIAIERVIRIFKSRLFQALLEEVKKKEEDKNDDERGNRKVYDIIVKCIWLKSSDVC